MSMSSSSSAAVAMILIGDGSGYGFVRSSYLRRCCEPSDDAMRQLKAVGAAEGGAQVDEGEKTDV